MRSRSSAAASSPLRLSTASKGLGSRAPRLERGSSAFIVLLTRFICLQKRTPRTMHTTAATITRTSPMRKVARTTQVRRFQQAEEPAHDLALVAIAAIVSDGCRLAASRVSLYPAGVCFVSKVSG